MFLTQAALPHLKASGGSVVNISSMGSQECAEGYIGYLVSKGRLKFHSRGLIIDESSLRFGKNRIFNRPQLPLITSPRHLQVI